MPIYKLVPFLLTLGLSGSAFAQSVESPPALVPYVGYLASDQATVNLQVEVVNLNVNPPQILWCQKTPALPVAKRRFIVNLGQIVEGITSRCVPGDYVDLTGSFDANGSPIAEGEGYTASTLQNTFSLDLFSRGTLSLRFKINGTRMPMPQSLNTVPYAATSRNGVPAGTVVAFMGSTPPSGWLLCDGAEYEQSEYPVLFNAIGTQYGQSGNRFNVPDLRGVFIRGLNDMGVNQNGNRRVGTRDPASRSLGEIQLDAYGRHSHGKGSLGGTTASDSHNHNLPIDNNGDGQGYGVSATGRSRFSGAHTRVTDEDNHSHTLSITGNTSTAGESETRPVNLAVKYIIKY